MLEVRGVMLKEGGIIDYLDKPRYISPETSDKFPRTQLKPGDLVMSVRGTLGKIGLVPDEIRNSNITANLMRLSPKRRKVIPKYMTCLLESYFFQNILEVASDQTTIKTITVPDLVSTILPIPSLHEQQSIANYLDSKTHKIDTLIEKKQKQIELLKEQRTAVINHAVTKGLNLDVKMKDSGIEWLGEIPAHWKVKHFKHLLKRKKGSIKTGPFGSQLKGGDFIDSGIRVYNQRTVLDNDFQNGKNFISREKYVSLKSFEVFPGDILITSRGTIGKCAIVPENYDIGVLHPCLIRLQVDSAIILNEYLKLFIQESECFKESILFESDATTIEVIYSDTLKNVRIPLPPLNEQQKILKKIELETGKIESFMDTLQREIKYFKEYRTTLISDAVTGKIDVRDEVPQ